MYHIDAGDKLKFFVKVRRAAVKQMNKPAKLEATLVRNFDLSTRPPTG